jgi:flagellum-specific peptidoglycan hydrolase FlgJ
MSYDDNAKWFESVFPLAERVRQSTGVFPSVTLAHWALETGYGTSSSYTEGNNIGGIKYVGQSQASGELYGHAKYDTIDQAVDDYIRVMQLGYLSLYRSAASPEDAIHLMDESPYAEDPQQGAKLLSIFNTYGLRGYDTYQGGGSSAGNPFGDIISKAGNLSPDELQKMAGIGLVVVALMAVMR